MLCFLALMLATGPSTALAGEPRSVGVLVLPGAEPTPGEAAARALCVDRYGGYEVGLTESGVPDLSPQTRALWWHCELVPLPGAMTSQQACQAVLAWLEAGGGLFLSGAAADYVHVLGLEPAPLRVGGYSGVDTFIAAVDPAPARGHPAYDGLDATAPIGLCSGGYPPLADYWGSGGPLGGVVIGEASPDAGEHPFVEYAYGSGRIVVLGWRLPHYGFAGNAYRDNLVRLTGNVLAYLASGEWYGEVADARCVPALLALKRANPDAKRRAVLDLAEHYPGRYPRATEYLAALDSVPELRRRLEARDTGAIADAERVVALLNEAMLANPLLDFRELVLVKRGASLLGLPWNWESNSSLPRTGYDNEIALLSPVGPEGALRTLFRPAGGEFVGDVDLDFDASRMLFSMPGPNGRWQVYEMRADGSNLSQLTLVEQPDVDNYDACYLPDGNVLFTSTAPMVGVPCVAGSSHVSNVYRWERSSGAIRRLTFGQDHDWCPTVMPDGRVLYLRWEYSDLPHFVSRILFTMNPDGTNQMAYYGSNSYWPNALFYARPTPGAESRFIAVVGGHHDNPRMGELALFDVSRGTFEADGCVQRVPGYGERVEPVLLDGLTTASWPKYLHPYPLSDKYFIVSCRPTPNAEWGIYLADVFDNLTLIKEVPGYALLEPLPLQPTRRPPVIPPRARPNESEATAYIADIYVGDGLRGVPRGAIKKLRLFTYHFAYHGVGGQVHRVGFDGPWDIKRVLGTVPVEPDGSAYFTVPANTPISIQPLDESGQALQLMRSWMTAMPGEAVSCVGCHESASTVVPADRFTLAAQREPSGITPWYGPVRGFSFDREVQPVLDRFCVGCHDGRPWQGGEALVDLRQQGLVRLEALDPGYSVHARFSPSYLALRRLVRGHTIESDMHLLEPGEYAADTTQLIRMLRAGHYGVELDPEAWDRLITWIDLNTPFHGAWHEILGEGYVAHQRERRREMDRLYAAKDEDPEALPPLPSSPPEPLIPPLADTADRPVFLEGWPLSSDDAADRQAALGATEMTLDLGSGVSLVLRRIPAGTFVMGDAYGLPNERPERVVRIERPFWLGATEVTNAQYALFDPSHDSRLEGGDFLQFSVEERGYPVNGPEQPVVRVSYHQAEAFCSWLYSRTGMRCLLPSEVQWEYACRAGTSTALWYGPTEADFAQYANLADAQLRRVDTYAPWAIPSGAIPEWRPAVATVDDGHRVSAPVASYRPSPWGLYDMHGNAAEWTSSPYTSYGGAMVVRGGSWHDTPPWARSAVRNAYPPYRRVFDVGFRVAAEAL